MGEHVSAVQCRLDPTHIVLALLGITGLTLFILACQPSWSPNGQKVLYSFYDDETQKAAVVTFNRRTGTSQTILIWADHDSSDDPFLAGAQWTKDGREAMLTLYDQESVQLLALPIDTKHPLRMYSLPKVGEPNILPMPQCGNKLFLMGDKTWARINLATGEMFTKEVTVSGDPIFHEAGGRVIYFKGIEAENGKRNEPAADKQQQTNKKLQDYELGELNQNDLTLQPSLSLTHREMGRNGIESFTGMFDEEPRTQRIAATIDSPPGIAIIGKNGVEQVLKTNLQVQDYKIGNPQWSRDAKLIFVPVLILESQTKKAELAIVEISLDGKSSRLDRIVQGPKEDFGDNFLEVQQIALSPDGQLIALSNGHLENLRPEKKGLFLLDVSRPDRPVRFYPAPALPALPKTTKE